MATARSVGQMATARSVGHMATVSSAVAPSATGQHDLSILSTAQPITRNVNVKTKNKCISWQISNEIVENQDLYRIKDDL